MAHPAILFEDNHCLAVAKAAGDLVQSDKTGDETLLESAKCYIAETYNKPGNVYLASLHRLDRPTSGVVLFARTSKAATRLADAFRQRTVTKRYLAVVQGNFTPRNVDGEGFCLLEDWLRKDPSANVSKRSREGEDGARHAVMRCRPIGTAQLSGRPATWVEVFLDTGRHHQIRAQLSARGHPVAGDLKYGAAEGFGRWIALHARELIFPHPIGGKEISVEAPLPKEWEIFGRPPT